MNSTAKLEIFLWLAQKQAERNSQAQTGAGNLLPEIESPESESNETGATEIRAESLAGVFEQLGETEIKKLRRLIEDFGSKSDAEKQRWSAKIETSIGANERFIDKNVHPSHIEAALRRETVAVRKIIEQFPNDLRNQEQTVAENKQFRAVKQTARKAFARQFVSLRQIKEPTAFDRLDGTELARLVRWAGIKEIAFACAQIEAVETVAAFLRRFSAEDARQIAAQLRSLPKVSVERLDFAENLVQTAFAEEENSSTMLDWRGIRLVCILLCNASPERLTYARQKFPVEFGAQLAEIIESACRETPAPLQTGVRAEIEQLAETVLETKARAR